MEIIPPADQTCISPFTNFVININAVTRAHRDHGDLEGCIVITIGPHEGGCLCLHEPRLVIETQNGDVVVFLSHRLTHYNLHYRGKRASIVIHSDRTGVAFHRSGNGWDGNIHYR